MKDIFYKILVSILGIILGLFITYLIQSLGKTLTITFLKVCFGYVILFAILFEIISKFKNKININISTNLEMYLVYFFSSILLSILLILAIKNRTEFTWFAFGGILPFGDAKDYFESIFHWPQSELNIVSSWRPLNVFFNSYIYFLGGSTLFGFIYLRIFLLALGIGFYYESVRNTLSMGNAIISLVLIIFFIFPFTNTFLTEINCIILSLFGYSFLLRTNIKSQNKYIYLGIFLLTIANLLRPFNVFNSVLLCSIFFLNNEITFKQKLMKFAFGSILVISFSLIVTKVVHNFVGNKQTEPNENFACIILGMTRNTNWNEATTYKKSTYKNLPTSKVLFQDMIKESIYNLKTNPYPTISYLKKSFLNSVQKLIYETSFQNRFFFIYSNKTLFLIFVLYILIIGVIFLKGVVNQNLAFVIGISLISFFSFSPIIFEAGYYWRTTAIYFIPFSLIIPILLQAIFQNKDKKIETKYKFNSSGKHISLIIILFLVSNIIFTITSFLFNKKEITDLKFRIYYTENTNDFIWKDFNSINSGFNQLEIWFEASNFAFVDSKVFVDYFKENKEKISFISIDYKCMKYVIVPKSNLKLPKLPEKNKNEVFFFPVFEIK